MIEVMVLAKSPDGHLAVQETFHFASVPRVGEQIVIIEPERDLTIIITSVVHLPRGDATVSNKAVVHAWGDVCDFSYQA